MPWNNQNGGGGWKGGGGGPWGQGPQGGGPSNQQPPDLEELLKRSQDKFKQAMPGGGGGVFWLVAIVLALVVWGFNSFHIINPDERGVILRFGKYHSSVDEGPRLIAWPMDTLKVVPFKAEKTLNFDKNLMLSGNQNLLDIQFTVLWKISDAKKYLFNTAQPDQLVQVVADSAMREVAGRTDANQMRTRNRAKAEQQVKDLIQSTLDIYDAGIQIRGVKLESAGAPNAEVRDAFDDVQRAKQDQAKFIEQAQEQKNKRLGVARGRVSKLIEDAKAEKAKVVAEAEGDAQHFISVYEQYKSAKDVTRMRIYLETLENVMRQSNKVVLEKGGQSGVLPYLPLPGLKNKQGGQ